MQVTYQILQGMHLSTNMVTITMEVEYRVPNKVCNKTIKMFEDQRVSNQYKKQIEEEQETIL